MSDLDNDISAPYDNVEFPVRKSGTGTWPGPSSASAGGGGAGIKLHGYQTTGRSVGGSKLAPVVEVDYSEGGDNNRLQTISFGNTQSTTSQQPQQPQQQQIQIKLNNLSTTSSNKVVMAPKLTEETVIGTNVTSTSVSSNISSTERISTVSSLPSDTTTTTSSASSGKQIIEKNTKTPPVDAVNDSKTYTATEVTSTETLRKKTLRQTESEEEDFKRQDLNPDARLALERVYTRHPDFYQLNTKVLEEGSLLKQDVLDIYRRTGETLTYEQLLQGMLVDGETFLLGSCWLYYTHVQFLDVEGTKILREPYGRGRIGLTSKRALFLSTETYTDANLEQFEQTWLDKKKGPDRYGYKLEVSKRSSVTFKNIPLSSFHSAEMEVITGTAVQTKITKEPKCCRCLCFMTGRWVSTPPMTRSINSRVLRVGVSMPPWQTRMFLNIHLDPTMSLTVARDFISQLHAFAPHMH
uniref:Uncharacterized protein n=1 Tax=Arion vulgaris TaxID=1028688 RepID=A0A0B7AJT5_9EUPU